MASIPCLLFLSLLCHSILLTKCDVDDDDLLTAINQYRANSNLTALNRTESADCIADGIVDMHKNMSCTVAAPPPDNTTLSNYPIPVSTCGLNSTTASRDGLVLATCAPDLPVSNFTSMYAASLNSTRFSVVGIGSQGNWTVVSRASFERYRWGCKRGAGCTYVYYHGTCRVVDPQLFRVTLEGKVDLYIP